MSMSPAPAGTVGVFMADRNPMNCQLMAATLRSVPHELRMVGYATDSAGVRSGLKQSQADVAIISAHLRDGVGVGLSVAKDVCTAHSQARVIMLLDFMEPALVSEAFRAGASGIFSRDQSFELLCKCIRAVHQARFGPAANNCIVLNR
jgi:DNA-binding NarL/FixJ family response regulator